MNGDSQKLYEKISEVYETLSSEINMMKDEFRATSGVVAKMAQVVYGDPDTGVEPIVKTMKSVSQEISTIQGELQKTAMQVTSVSSVEGRLGAHDRKIERLERLERDVATFSTIRVIAIASLVLGIIQLIGLVALVLSIVVRL